MWWLLAAFAVVMLPGAVCAYLDVKMVDWSEPVHYKRLNPALTWVIGVLSGMVALLMFISGLS